MLVFYGDTNSELNYKLVDKYKINMINMPYILGDELKQADLGRYNAHIEFFDRVEKGETPTTCGLNKQDYIDYWEKHLQNGDDIIYITFSNSMSNTFEYMNQAIAELKEKYPERFIKYVDSKKISVGEALILEEAFKQYENGKTADEIISFVEDFREHVSVYFAVDDLNHLKRGGRISGATAFFGTLLQIKPILEINKEGKIVSVDKAKGRKYVVAKLLEKVKEFGENVADYPIYVIDAKNSIASQELKEELINYCGKDADIRVQCIGPTIGTHCGVGTIGISFHSKRV